MAPTGLFLQMPVDGASLIKEKVAYPEKKENDCLGETLFLVRTAGKLLLNTPELESIK